MYAVMKKKKSAKKRRKIRTELITASPITLPKFIMYIMPIML